MDRPPLSWWPLGQMAPAPGQIDELTLQGYLLAHADEFRRYVDTRVPSESRSFISADDVLQETWVAAFRGLSGFRNTGPMSLDSWLFTIASRKLLDAIKAARRLKRDGARLVVRNVERRRSSMVDLFSQVASSGKTPSSEVSIREASDAVRIALGGLEDDCRRAIEMTYVDGLSRREIAARMGRSDAAINSLLFRGLRKLRERLGHAAKFFSDWRSSDGQGSPSVRDRARA